MPDTVLTAILAAGRATRFGGGKLDADCGGKPLGQWALDAARGAGVRPEHAMLIVGPDKPDFAAQAALVGWTVITNPSPEDGIGLSVSIATAHAECLGADALLFLLADMPLVDEALIAAMITHHPLSQPVALRHSGGRPGVPARLPASMFRVLMALEGDEGAGRLLTDRNDMFMVEGRQDALLDVDDMQSLREARIRLGHSSHP